MNYELLRVEFKVIGLAREDDKTPSGEVELANGAAYAAGLDKLPDSIRSVIEQANDDAEGPDDGSVASREKRKT